MQISEIITTMWHQSSLQLKSI